MYGTIHDGPGAMVIIDVDRIEIGAGLSRTRTGLDFIVAPT